MKSLWSVCVLALCTAATLSAAEPIEVMVLGTYHFGNPGADLNNMKADDVLVPKRQKELQQLTDSLAKFQPNRIMVEEEGKGSGFESADYSRYTPELLSKERSETTQIAFRLAHKLGHKAVHAIDEQPAAGEPNYFPVEKVDAYAKANGMQSQWKDLKEDSAKALKIFEEKQKIATIAELLIDRTDPKNRLNNQDFYYRMLVFGNGEDQPGADLNAAWYLHNAKIFAKLQSIAKPGDRVLVVYGAGHRYWLRHFVDETPGFKAIDPIPYLRKAKPAQ
ncbi:MAG TPA: DUF5694 domain-containing protein [Oligoflexus sp.]|uniref:DUF5694 domain-containing protein n=1 Tax=Oligoflexus sp. TaxID=1971216 RepID=UPI002D4B94D7|nr:DUF5694 domain-containing protein [Oligoflexus sp.]HYX39370.1 DUF5694 domain-containing protein [Oligoflexus sp.]